MWRSEIIGKCWRVRIELLLVGVVRDGSNSICRIVAFERRWWSKGRLIVVERRTPCSCFTQNWVAFVVVAKSTNRIHKCLVGIWRAFRKVGRIKSVILLWGRRAREGIELWRLNDRLSSLSQTYVEAVHASADAKRRLLS